MRAFRMQIASLIMELDYRSVWCNGAADEQLWPLRSGCFTSIVLICKRAAANLRGAEGHCELARRVRLYNGHVP